jgi:hypothetical protein
MLTSSSSSYSTQSGSMAECARVVKHSVGGSVGKENYVKGSVGPPALSSSPISGWSKHVVGRCDAVGFLESREVAMVETIPRVEYP